MVGIDHLIIVVVSTIVVGNILRIMKKMKKSSHKISNPIYIVVGR